MKISILLLFGEILTTLLPKDYTEVILKVNIFCLLLIQELKQSGYLRSAQERPWALKSVHEHS